MAVIVNVTLPTAASPSSTSLTLLLGLGAEVFPESAISYGGLYPLTRSVLGQSGAQVRLSRTMDPFRCAAERSSRIARYSCKRQTPKVVRKG